MFQSVTPTTPPEANGCRRANRAAAASLVLRLMLGMVALSLWPAAAGWAQQAKASDDPGVAFFESKIRPLLVQHCYKCHSAATATPEGGLRVDSREAIRSGGDRGPAVVPGKPKQSLLLTAISHSDPDLQMPPKKDRLSAEAVKAVEAWIRMGAPDPRDASEVAKLADGLDLEAARRFWAYRKPAAPRVPQPKQAAWARGPIDHFILAKLESQGLAPRADSPMPTLLRRLYFDLIGLPPSTKQLWTFAFRVEGVGFEAAWRAEVDALLASEQFGERWGRHWLDVARFAESSGKEANISFPYAWRYRDYVIDCFNADKPYDEFLVEQIAGDLLPYDTQAQRARLLIATGFLALGSKNLDEADGWQFLADVIDEQIDTVTRAVTANSVACARCHDHKFDPYSMEDYYALAGVFASTKTYFGTHVSPANRVGGDPLRLPEVEGQLILHQGIPPQQVEKLKSQLKALQAEQKAGMAAVKKAIAAGEDASDIFTLTDALRIFWTSGGIEGQLEKVDEAGRPLPLAMGVLDREQIVDAPLLERGDIKRPGKPVPRGFPRVVQLSDPPRPASDHSGRLEFAHWLTHKDHPLTARVMANRIWHYLLGAGIVRTVDNFGMTGERPSHPKLLDYLAVRFVKHGWSTKSLVREIVNSSTYRQASTFDRKSFEADPDNRLLWRASKRRLDAEAIRDAMLAVSAELDPSRPRGSLVGRVIGDRPISLIGLDKSIPSDLDGSLHRSVYLPVLRDNLPDVFDLFDFAEPSLVTGARETTNVPVQALYLMNSPFVMDRAKALAKHVGCQTQDDEDRIREAYLLCFTREPDAEELRLGLAFLQAHALRAKSGDGRQQALTNYCHALLATAEFRNLD